MLAATTNQREADKFVENDAGETAIRTIVDAHDVEISNLPTEYPLPTSQITTLTPLPAITGFATSAKQLPDNHNVTVSNHPSEFPLPTSQITTLTPPEAITGFATSAKQLADNHQVTVSNPQVNIQDKLVTGRTVGVTPNRQLMTTSLTRLVGTMFDGDTLDANFWTETITLSGTVTVDGECDLATGTTANATAKIKSVRRARFVPSSPNKFQTTCEWHSAGDADNIRRIGMYDDDNGFFFQYDGTTFSIGSRTNKSGSPVDTLVASASFNQTVWAPGTDRVKVSIGITGESAYFFGGGNYLHKLALTHDNHPTTFTLPITMENNNDNSNTTNNEFHCIGAVINRVGELHTLGKYHYASAATTTILKRTAGTLQRVVITDSVNATMTVYDGLSAGGTVMAVLDASKTTGTMEFQAPFSDGLTIVTTGAPKMTVIYE